MPFDNSQIKTLQMENSELLPHVIELLKEKHTVTLPLRGFSMRPFLEDQRDKALLKYRPYIDKGDVVLAEIAPGKYVLHRIVAIGNKYLTLQGDGNLTKEYCLTKDIRAVAIGFYRKGRDTLDSTDGWKWKIYSAVWTFLTPIRRYLLFIYRLTKKL